MAEQDRLRGVLAIELLCATEAAEYVDDDLAHGVGTATVYETVRDVVESLDGDRPLAGDIDAIDELPATGMLRNAVRESLDDGFASLETAV